MSIDTSENAQELIPKLLAKISEQAKELAQLSGKHEKAPCTKCKENLNNSNRFSTIKAGGDAFSDSISVAAQKRRIERQHQEQLNALQQQLDTATHRLQESSKKNKQQITEIETLTRDLHFFQKRCHDYQHEIQALQSVVEKQGRTDTPQKPARTSHKTLRNLNDAITDYERKLSETRAEMEEYKLHIRVLEDALEFRANELGIAGHSDLLAKVARLRGEVTALKNELTQKDTMIEEAQHVTASLSHDRDELRNKVNAIQQRLAESQQDMSRLAHGDIVATLKAVEHERDVLIEFIQADMEKSTTIAKDLDAVRNELQHATKEKEYYEKQYKSFEEQANKESQRLRSLQHDLSSLNSKYDEVMRMKQIIENQRADIQKLYDKKCLEADELCQMQLTLFSQEKEREVQEKEQVALEWRSKCDIKDADLAKCMREVESLREHITSLQENLIASKQQLSQSQPRLMQLEPEVRQLHHAKVEWEAEKVAMHKELRELRSLRDQMDQLNDDLKDTPLDEEVEQISQRHAMWSAVPTLRKVNPALYERVRQMFQDMRRLENELSDINSKYQRQSVELSNALRSHDAEMEQMLPLQSKVNHTIAEYKQQLARYEDEIAHYRSNQIIISRIRSVLASFPHVIAQMRKITGSDAPEGELAQQVSVEELPDLINTALMFNNASVSKLRDAESELTILREETQSLRKEASAATAENYGLKQSISDLKQYTETRERKMTSYEASLKEDLISAADLAEKQNALIMALEAKVVELRRRTMLKGAQVTSYTQREQSMHMKLHESLQMISHGLNLRDHVLMLGENTKFPQLIHAAIIVLYATMQCADEGKRAEQLRSCITHLAEKCQYNGDVSTLQYSILAGQVAFTDPDDMEKSLPQSKPAKSPSRSPPTVPTRHTTPLRSGLSAEYAPPPSFDRTDIQRRMKQAQASYEQLRHPLDISAMM